MYTLLVNDENQVITTNKETIMQRTNCADKIQILIRKQYRDVDMSNAVVYMEYKLPISNKLKLIQLNKGTYKDDAYMQFIVPGDLQLTSEAGDIAVVFKMYSLQIVGEDTVWVNRNSQEGHITITPIVPWSDIEIDEMFSGLDQRLIALEMLSQNLEAQSQAMYENMATDIVIDDGKIHIETMNGATGEGVSLDDISEHTISKMIDADMDGEADGVTYLDQIFKDSEIISIDDLIK